MGAGSCIVGDAKMTAWTPDDVRRVLDSRDRPTFTLLITEVCRAVEVGRARFLYGRHWARDFGARSKEDDVNDVVVRLLSDEARLLRKYGAYSEFIVSEDSLRKYVIGVTWNVLRKQYQKPVARWKDVTADICSLPEDPGFYRGITHLTRVIDLERAVGSLSISDQELFRLIYDEQHEPAVIAEKRGVSRQALDAQKSRLLKRLARFLSDTGGRREDKDDD